MVDADLFARSYLFVDVQRDARGDAVAELFEAAAAALRGHGEVSVHHVAFDTEEHAGTARTSLTVYYERVERRRLRRTESPPVTKSVTTPQSLRAVADL